MSPGARCRSGLAGEVEWPDGVVAEPFLDDEVVGIAAPGRLRGASASVEDARGETLLVREPGSSTRAVADRQLARVGYRPAKRWELDSNEAIKRSVRAGLGVGFVSRLVVEEELERGELDAFTVEGAGTMRRSVYLLRRTAATRCPPSARSSRRCARAARRASPAASSNSCPPGIRRIADLLWDAGRGAP